MMTWAHRAREEAHLLNPAFCGALISLAVAEYVESEPRGLPYSLSPIILPVVLHKRTRELLPRSVRTSLASWLDESPSVRLGLVERVRALVPYSREAVLFAGSHRALRFVNGGRLATGPSSISTTKYERTTTDEARACLRSARLIGRWFAAAGSEHTVLLLWGIRP